MEIVLVLVVLMAIAAAGFAYLRRRPRDPSDLREGGAAPGPRLRGARRARIAARHDPMAVAVERHAAAIEPHEAVVAEAELQTQARSVAAELHAEQARRPDPAAAQVEAARAAGSRRRR